MSKYQPCAGASVRSTRSFHRHSSNKEDIVPKCSSPPLKSLPLQNTVTPTPRLPSRPYSLKECTTFSEIYLCYFCEKEFTKKEEMRQHQSNCADRPPQLQLIQRNQKADQQMLPSPPGPPPMSPKAVRKETIARLPKDSFTRYLDLVPKQKAERLRSRNRNSLEIQCDARLDLSEPETPVSPCTPRTPKSLISQLSREEPSLSKKRLSYSLSMDKSGEKIEGDSQSVCSESSDDTEDSIQSKGNKTLLSIAVSSLLGQRVQRHVRVEQTMQVVANSENFCKTPVKNAFLDKLRTRPPSYPVTYKPRRKSDLKNMHFFKFNKKQKKEFMARVNTGLNKESRDLMKKMKKLRVSLKRMSIETMLRWVPPKVLERQLKGKVKIKRKKLISSDLPRCEFPGIPSLLADNIDLILGLKRRSNSGGTPMKSPLKSPLSLSNVVSEDVDAEVSKQKLTLYRSLLSELAIVKPQMAPLPVTSKPPSSSPGKSLKSLLNVGPKQEGKGKGLKKGNSPMMQEINKISSTAMSQSRSPIRGQVETDLGKNILRLSYPQLGVPMSPPVGTTVVDSRTVGKPTVMDDQVSIISISSDEGSLKSNCCSGCRDKKHAIELSPSLPLSPSPPSCLKAHLDLTPPATSPAVPVQSSMRTRNQTQVAKETSMEPLSICVDSGPTEFLSPERLRTDEMSFLHKSLPSPASSTHSVPSIGGWSPIKARLRSLASGADLSPVKSSEKKSPGKMSPDSTGSQYNIRGDGTGSPYNIRPLAQRLGFDSPSKVDGSKEAKESDLSKSCSSSPRKSERNKVLLLEKSSSDPVRPVSPRKACVNKVESDNSRIIKEDQLESSKLLELLTMKKSYSSPSKIEQKPLLVKLPSGSSSPLRLRPARPSTPPSDNQYSLRSGNFVMLGKRSPTKVNVVPMNSSSSTPTKGSPSKVSKVGKIEGLTSSPVRRSKRVASSPAEIVSSRPSKLRRVQTELNCR